MGERSKTKEAPVRDMVIHPERMKVREVMTSKLLTLRVDDSVEDAARALEESHIGGAPVVDGSGNPLGVFTSTDVTRAFSSEGGHSGRGGGFVDGLESDDEEMDVEGALSMRSGYSDELTGDVRVGDWMTPSIVWVTPDASIGDVCRRMREESIHRVFVVDKQKLVGVVSASDLVGLLAGEQR